jgi:hypothetical protein
MRLRPDRGHEPARRSARNDAPGNRRKASRVVRVCNFGNRSLHRLLPRHHDGCGCRNRRPETSLIGASEFDIDLARSYMAGDRYSDLEARMPRVVRPLSLIVHTENAAHPVPQSFFEDTRSSDQAARRLVCTASQDLGLNVSQSGHWVFSSIDRRRHERHDKLRLAGRVIKAAQASISSSSISPHEQFGNIVRINANPIR